MSTQRILVVDDEESILKVVEYALAGEGYEVHTARDAAAAHASMTEFTPDLVILDVMLPDQSGLDIARDLRAHSDVPIVMLSARADEVDRVLGLELGADDYMTKPFSPRELVSRVKSVLRRSGGASDDKTSIVVGDLKIDTASRQVRMGDALIHLTHTEYGILVHLAQHPGTAFPRESITASVWNETSVSDERAIDVHVHNIREKIEPDPKDPTYIHTVRGYGYRLREP